MNDAMVEKALVELQECWPYQEIPQTHFRHWREVLRSFSRETVKKVLSDCKTTMTGRPGWGEFGKLCSELSLAEAKKARQGPYLDSLPAEYVNARGPISSPDQFTAEIQKLRDRLKVKS